MTVFLYPGMQSLPGYGSLRMNAMDSILRWYDGELLHQHHFLSKYLTASIKFYHIHATCQSVAVEAHGMSSDGFHAFSEPRNFSPGQIIHHQRHIPRRGKGVADSGGRVEGIRESRQNRKLLRWYDFHIYANIANCNLPDYLRYVIAIGNLKFHNIDPIIHELDGVATLIKTIITIDARFIGYYSII